jgi:hypothetical protein
VADAYIDRVLALQAIPASIVKIILPQVPKAGVGIGHYKNS